MHVGQAEVTALIAEGEAFMVKAELVEGGGMVEREGVGGDFLLTR
jgi:hypothetical protein